MDSNRRRAPRQLTCIAAGVKTNQKEGLGLIKDASAQGALLLSQADFAIGDPVTLRLMVEDSPAPTIDIEARVVRTEPVLDGLWVNRLGVEFTPPRPDLAPTLERLADAAKALLG
jgi:hypothetical protein